jgi:hypothetical protein
VVLFPSPGDRWWRPGEAVVARAGCWRRRWCSPSRAWWRSGRRRPSAAAPARPGCAAAAAGGTMLVALTPPSAAAAGEAPAMPALRKQLYNRKAVARCIMQRSPVREPYENLVVIFLMLFLESDLRFLFRLGRGLRVLLTLGARRPSIFLTLYPCRSPSPRAHLKARKPSLDATWQSSPWTLRMASSRSLVDWSGW